jgi:hypothetical protein
MHIALLVKYPLFLLNFNENLSFFGRLLKNPQMSNLMEIRPVGAILLHVGGQTDMTKLIVTFHNFSEAPKKWNGFHGTFQDTTTHAYNEHSRFLQYPGVYQTTLVKGNVSHKCKHFQENFSSWFTIISMKEH